MGYQERLKTDLHKMIESRGYDIKEVINWAEEERYGGYCDTCYYDWTVIAVYYLDSNGEEKLFDYNGNLADFLSEMDSLGE